MNFHIENLETKFYLLRILDFKKEFYHISQSLTNQELTYINITLTPYEATILIPTIIYNKYFPIFDNSNILKDPVTYQMCDVTTNEPAKDDTGLLADVTQRFKEEERPILVISTYSQNLIFYPTETIN